MGGNITQLIAGEVEGGGGGAAQDIFELEMDTSIGMGMLNLSSEASYNAGDILIITASNPANGGFIFPSAPDTINGEINLALGAAQTVLLRATGTGDWSLLATAPNQYRVEFAAGGDTFTLPALSTVPAGTCYLVVFNSGSGVVTVEPYAGDTLTGGNQTINTTYAGMVFINTGYGAWEPYSQTSALPTPAPTTLISIALANNALHCWGGRANPFEDLAGSADFTPVTGQAGIPPIPVCVEGMLLSNQEATTFGGPVTGATACSLSRSGSDRSFAWLFRCSAEDAGGDAVLLRLGVTTKGLCTIRLTSNWIVDDPATWPTGTTTLTTAAAIRDAWVLLTGWWEEAENTLHLFWSIGGAAEGSNDHEATDTPTSGEDQIQLGYNSTYSDTVYHAFLAVWDDSTGVDIRSQLYAALGWTP